MRHPLRSLLTWTSFVLAVACATSPRAVNPAPPSGTRADTTRDTTRNRDTVHNHDTTRVRSRVASGVVGLWSE